MSGAERLTGALRRRRRRFYYEVVRPEAPVAEMCAALAPGLHADLNAPDGFPQLWNAHLASTPGSLWSVTPSATLDAIECLRRGEVRVLTRALTITPGTDWHLEPFHGVRWPKVHVESCPFTVPRGDLVVLWHLNRMSFLVDYARAYRATRDESIASTAYALMDSWVRANPYLVGANWISPMEVGLRLVAWSLAAAGLSGAPLPEPERCERILRSVLRQARFLASHFSRWPVPNNHLIGEAATLSAFAAYWPVFRESAAWMTQAEDTLVEEARRQVLRDGFHFEHSVNYHLVVLDYFLLYLHAKLIRGEEPHAFVLEQARVMADAALSLVAPSGRMPMIGDDSMPHFVVIAGTMGSPGPVSASVCFEAFLRVEHARLFATTAWGRDLLTLSKAVAGARRFHEAGIDVARDAHGHVAFTHGPQHHHPFSHGHLHADAGSFELELEGVPLVVDSGTYLYGVDPAVRAHVRGARAHNTVVVNGVEPMKPTAPFQWESVASAEALAFGAEGDVVATGSRRRLPGLHGTVEHTRALVRVGETVIVVDALSPRAGGSGPAHTAALYFHTTTAPGVAVRDEHRVRLSDAARFVRVFEVLDEPRASIDLVDDPANPTAQYSTAYGEISSGTTIRVSIPVEQTVVLACAFRLPEVTVTRARTRIGHVGCAIEDGHTRRIVSVRMDPFAVFVGGRAVTASDPARGTPAPAARPSDALEWLDEIDA